MLQDLEQFTGEQKLQDILFSKENVRKKTGVVIKELLTKDGELSGVKIIDGASQKQEIIECDGLFIAIGLIPENGNYTHLADLNDWGYFDSKEDCTTKTPGLFVAGDCRSKSIRQVTTATADGAVAALAACRYIDSNF